MKDQAMKTETGGLIYWPDVSLLHRELLLKGLTQNRLAGLAKLNRRTIAKLFNEQLGSALTVRIVCEALGIQMEALLPDYLKGNDHG